jgi:polyisoprenoid-binding protein YceI
MAKQFDFSGEELKGVTGELTLLGKTHDVALKTRQFNCYRSPLFGRDVCGGDFEATLDRTAWGLNYGLIFGFPREVRLLIQVEAIRQ